MAGEFSAEATTGKGRPDQVHFGLQSRFVLNGKLAPNERLIAAQSQPFFGQGKAATASDALLVRGQA